MDFNGVGGYSRAGVQYLNDSGYGQKYLHEYKPIPALVSGHY
jgi:hypothetical protein